jgi:hypothetical protein
MRRSCALLLLAVLLTAGPTLVASAEEAEAPFPYGRWEGSAVGDGLDEEGNPKTPIAVKIWLSRGDDGTVTVTVSTPAVPFSFDAEPATPTKVAGGWDLPVTVAYGTGERAINGSGIVRLRQRADGWYAWGSGSGSALGGQPGSGHGSAKRVSVESSLFDQVWGPIKDTAGSVAGSVVGEDAPVAVPEEYPEAEFAEAPAEASAEEPVSVDPARRDAAPAALANFLILLILFVLYGIYGLLMFLLGPDEALADIREMDAARVRPRTVPAEPRDSEEAR